MFTPDTGHVNIAVANPQLVISAARLQLVFQKVREHVHSNRPKLGISARLTLDNTFVIRVKGRAISETPALHQLDQELQNLLVSNVRFEPDERPDILFVQDGIAYVDPRHELPLQNYLDLAQLLSERVGKRAVLDFEGEEYLTYHIVNPGQSYIAASYHQQLVELLEPSYRLVGRLSGSYDEQGIRIRIRLAKLPKQPVNLEPLSNLRFIVKPPPRAEWRSGSYIVEFHIGGRPTDTPRIWEKASAAALKLGVYPTGDFNFQLNERTRVTYTPPTLSIR